MESQIKFSCCCESLLFQSCKDDSIYSNTNWFRVRDRVRVRVSVRSGVRVRLSLGLPPCL